LGQSWGENSIHVNKTNRNLRGTGFEDLRHLETGEDVEQELELMREVFGKDERVDLLVRKWIDHHPAMKLEDFLVVKHHGRVVAGLCLIPQTWSVGGIPLKVAELGCVATLREYRNRGLQRKLMDEYHRRVADQRYDLSVIEGIPFFYRQFGYEYALPLNEQTTIRLDQIPDYEQKHYVRPFTDSDIKRGMKHLENSQHKLLVHSVRDEDTWNMQQKTSMAGEYLFEGYVVEESSETVAYFRTAERPESKELILAEASDMDLGIQSVLRFLKEKGKKRGHETLVARTSCHDSLTQRIVAESGAQTAPAYAWQIRITDHVEVFRKLKPLLEKRLAESEHCHLSGELSFNFYRHTVQMRLKDGTIESVERLEESEDRTVRFNPFVFVKLLLGYRSREELENMYPDFIVKPEAKSLIDTLFPKLPSYIHNVF
jgi:predicted N-acetyltransferase YhbS